MAAHFDHKKGILCSKAFKTHLKVTQEKNLTSVETVVGALLYHPAEHVTISRNYQAVANAVTQWYRMTRTLHTRLTSPSLS
ncbi:hypothetical protein MTO96_019361 [Rhipicephalus appendiculatus]